MFNHLDTKLSDDKEILDKHLERYLESINKTILISELVILISTLIIAYLVIKGIYPYKIHSHFHVPIKVYFFEQFVHKIISWIILGTYLLFYKKLPLKKRQNLLCIIAITLTSLLSFGSWNVNYFGFLFIIPIIISSPFSKKTNKIVSIICIILELIYTTFQVYIRHDKYNYIVGLTSLSCTIAFYFFGKTIHKTMYNTLLDVKQFTYITKSLYEEVSHDFLTNAFSISELYKDLDEKHSYKSLAFLDVDNFKSINDKLGHSIGDDILKLLVTIIQNYNIHIYRYGGDEFVVISKDNKNNLVHYLEEIKSEFTKGSYDYFNVKATLSVGVIDISNKGNSEDYLKECDKVMYISKNSGKNKITIA